MGKHLRSKKVVIHKNTENSIIYILLLNTIKEIEVGVRAVLRTNTEYVPTDITRQTKNGFDEEVIAILELLSSFKFHTISIRARSRNHKNKNRFLRRGSSLDGSSCWRFRNLNRIIRFSLYLYFLITTYSVSIHLPQRRSV